jgi:hypothetical protein
VLQKSWLKKKDCLYQQNIDVVEVKCEVKVLVSMGKYQLRSKLNAPSSSHRNDQLIKDIIPPKNILIEILGGVFIS